MTFDGVSEVCSEEFIQPKVCVISTGEETCRNCGEIIAAGISIQRYELFEKEYLFNHVPDDCPIEIPQEVA